MALDMWTSFVALAISLASLALGVLNNRKQNRRWTALNRARISVSEPKLHNWGDVSRSLALSGAINYDLLLYEDNDDPERLAAYGKLTFHNPVSGERRFGHGRYFTVAEMTGEASRLECQDCEIVQFLQFEFPIKNIGKLPAESVQAWVSLRFSDGSIHRLTDVRPSTTVFPDDRVILTAPMSLPLSEDVPDELVFEVQCDYLDAEGGAYKSTSLLKWDKKINNWHVLGSEDRSR